MLYIRLIWKYKWFVMAAAIAALLFYQHWRIESLKCDLNDETEKVISLESQVKQLKINHELDEKYNQEYIDHLKSAEQELIDLKNKLQEVDDISVIEYRDSTVPCGVKALFRNKNHVVLCN